MIPNIEELLAEENLTFTLKSGTFDVELIAAAIAGIGYPYRDELNPSCFAIFSAPKWRDDCRARRLADPSSTFPYVLLVADKPHSVRVYPVSSQEDLRVLSVQFLEWMLSHYTCRIENEFGTDMTAPAE